MDGLEQQARAGLRPEAYDFYAGGSGREVTLRANVAAWPGVPLPAVAAALRGSPAEVYVDGGIRTGYDVLAALALGARAVFVGRPVLWALACGGAGLEDVAARHGRFHEVRQGAGLGIP